MTKLIEFVRADDLAGVQQELAAGANAYAQDKNGFTALQHAAMFGKTRVLRRLLEHTVDIRRSTANDWNPLALALRYSHFDAAAVLLDAGADVNAPQPIGRVAPLKFAAGYGNAPMVQRLLELGADPHAMDERGATALDSARHNMEATPTRQAAYAQIVRLLEAAIRGAKGTPHAETKTDIDAPGDDFFDFWRENRVASMTLLDLHEDGALYYYESPYSCTVWVFVGVESLIISYRIKGDGPEQVRAEMRRLLDALHGRSDPAGVMTQFYPNYAARRNPATGELKVANFRPGDWFGLTRLPLPVHWDQLPGDWPAAHRSRIADLVTERIRIAEQADSFQTLNTFAHGLAGQSRYSDAERILRRALAICEKTVGPEHEDVASCVQSVGSTLAFQARYPEAEAMMRRALELWTRLRGPDDANVASALRSIGAVLERSGNLSEAAVFKARAQEILAKIEHQPPER